MDKLQKTIGTLSVIERGEGLNSPVGARSLVLSTGVFLVTMLSVPVGALDRLLWFALYPILAAPITGTRFTGVFIRSLWVVPFAAFLAMFNPILDTGPALQAGDVTISRGWVEFTGIILRTLLSIQALLVLTSAHGFIGLCRGLRQLHTPQFIIVQLLMVYRYIKVLLEEALSMRRARQARGYGRKDLSLRLWGTLTGQLFLRTVDRAGRVHQAMQARLFRGGIPFYNSTPHRWSRADTMYLIIWTAVCLALRLLPLNRLLF